MELANHDHVKDARSAYIEKMEQLEEERNERIITFVTQNPGETAYSISKALDIPRSTMIKLLDQLEEDMEIKFDEVVENGRLKKKVFVRTISDFTYDHFHEDTLSIPLVQKLVQNTQDKGSSVVIETKDGGEKVFGPDDDIFGHFGIQM